MDNSFHSNNSDLPDLNIISPVSNLKLLVNNLPSVHVFVLES